MTDREADRWMLWTIAAMWIVFLVGMFWLEIADYVGNL